MMKIPGFRFRPTGVELIKYFLKRKVMGKNFKNQVITELDIYKCAPWDLPDKSLLQNGDLEWYFFCPIEKKYGSGGRLNRATEIGFWKATGKDRAVQHNNQTVGMIKTLVFHLGKAPRGDRTDWVMHEYRLEDKELANRGIVQDSYVICKVFQKEGPGPMNGAQYGRPFNEEDWSDDEVVLPFAESVESVLSAAVTTNSSVRNDQNLHASSAYGSMSMPCQLRLTPFSDPANNSCPDYQAVNDDDILSMLDFSTDPANHSYPDNQAVNNDDILSMLDFSNDNDNDISPEENIVEGAPSSDFFEGLGDLNCSALGSFGQNVEFSTNGMAIMVDVGHDNLDFIELTDLDEFFRES